MESIIAFFVGIPLLLVGIPILWFYSCVGVLAIAVVWSLAGDKESWGWAGIWTLLLGIGFYFRFDPSIQDILTGLVVWIPIGIVYSFVHWYLQLRKLRQRVDEAINKLAWPDPFPPNSTTLDIGIDTRGCDLDYEPERRIRREDYGWPIPDGDSDTDGEAESEAAGKGDGWVSKKPICDAAAIRRSFIPKFRHYRGLVTVWTIFWPIFVLKDLTIDLIETIQDFLKGIYQRMANAAFE